MVLACQAQPKKSVAAEYAEAIVEGASWDAPLSSAQLAIMEAMGWSQRDYDEADAWLIDMAEARLEGRGEGAARRSDRAGARNQTGNPATQLMAAGKRKGRRQ